MKLREKMPNTVLHITDMHIINPSDAQELLGLNYKEYVTQFIEKIKENEFLPDCIVATGDFVEQGNIKNFDHAKEILIYLAKKLDLSNEKIAVCCGGHDIIVAKDSIGKSEDARKPFNEFFQSFVNSNPINSNERASLCKLSEGIFILLLDATLGSNGENKPGTLSDKEIDDIINDFIIDKFDEDALLIVGTHYPLTASVSHYLIEQEPDWIERHIWKGKAGRLYNRITDLRASKQTLWLCGDIHYPDHFILSKGSYFVTSGRFGSSSESAIYRQGKVIRVYNTQKTPPKIMTIEYKPMDFKGKNYRWQSVFSSTRSIDENLQSEAIVTSDDGKVSFGEKENRARTTKMMEGKECIIELIDEELEKTLISKIEGKGLYTLGRFHTSEDNISLSWVSIGPLLNSTGVITSIIEKMNLWVKDKLDKLRASEKDIVLLGMDCWGAVLASELSVVSGIDNYCIAARGRGSYHTSSELINEDVARELTRYKIVIFVCDVLATGHSIKFIYDDIQKKWKEMKESPRVSWFCLSIIMDEQNTRRIYCDFIKMYGTTCKNLRMLVATKDALPNETIMPPTISFS